MNILILNWRDPNHPLAGGAEKSVLNHATYWMRKGAKVSWFAASFKGAKKEEQVEGIKVVRAGNHHTTHLLFFVYRLLGKFKGVDLVIDCFHFSPFFSPLFMPRTKKIALVQETAGRLWFENAIFPLSLFGFLLEPFFFKFYRNVDFITGSDSTVNEVRKMGIRKNRIHLIFHGVDKVKVNAEKEKNPTLLYLGRLSKDKGFEDASVAAALIKKKIPKLNFWVVGREEKKGDFNWYIGNARKFVKYFGFVGEKEKFELLKKAWILIHPSEKEGWGLTVIEAATQGTLTVGYDVPGLRDSIINGKTGVLTGKKSEALAQAIISLVNDKKGFDKMSKQAYAWSLSFDWEKAGKESWKVICHL